MGDEGPVFVYSGFEKGVLAGLAARFSSLGAPLAAIASRLVDLLPVTRAAWYHPAMKGSWSIKEVLPTVAPELDYADLGEVHDGTAAQVAFAEAVHPRPPTSAPTSSPTACLPTAPRTPWRSCGCAAS